MKNVISTSKEYSQSKRDIRYFYKQYEKIIDTIPDYMRKNLSEMPNNKGYIWRGCGPCWIVGDVRIVGPSCLLLKRNKYLIRFTNRLHSYLNYLMSYLVVILILVFHRNQTFLLERLAFCHIYN